MTGSHTGDNRGGNPYLVALQAIASVLVLTGAILLAAPLSGLAVETTGLGIAALAAAAFVGALILAVKAAGQRPVAR